MGTSLFNRVLERLSGVDTPTKPHSSSFPHRPKPTASAIQAGDLDTPLLMFSPKDPWTLRDACEGTQIFGGTGSGKTTGSGHALAKAFLQAGYGGLVLTAKPEDRALWEGYCKAAGREKSLIVFSPENPHTFNFLEYERRRPGRGGGLADNIVRLFISVLEDSEPATSSSENERFWREQTEMLLNNAVSLLMLADEPLSLDHLDRLITSALTQTTNTNTSPPSYLDQCLEQAASACVGTDQERSYQRVNSYWRAKFPHIPEKQRSTTVSIFSGMMDKFLRDPLYRMFCTSTTILPEMTHDGAIILIDLPVKEFHDVGRFGQILFKYVWQRATEGRDITHSPRPCFLWADEAQFFLSRKDVDFQTTARSSRALTVYLTQNLNNYYAQLGGDKAKPFVHSLLGNLQTKIFHMNGDPDTNEWAANIFSKDLELHQNMGLSEGSGDSWSEQVGSNWGTSGGSSGGQASGSSSHGGSSGSSWGSSSNQNQSLGYNQVRDYKVPPVTFTQLKKPGRQPISEAVIFAGRNWKATGDTFIKCSFNRF